MSVDVKDIDYYTDQILNDIATGFNVDVSDLGDTYIVDAKSQGGMIYQLYLGLANVERNIFTDLSQTEILIREGVILLGRTPAPATGGVYEVQVNGEIGAVIDAGQRFKANDDFPAAGNLFILDNQFTLTAETETITLRSLTPGLDAKLFTDDLLTAINPIVNVDSEVKVTGIATEPTDAEDIESYRADVLEAKRLIAQGGSASDYRLWASDEPTVRTIFPYTTQGASGNIDIYIEATPENTADGQVTGVPTQDTLDAVYKVSDGINPESGVLIQNPDNGRARKPMTVQNVLIYPISIVPVDIEFTDLTDNNKASEIKTAIDNLLYNVRPFIACADVVGNRNDLLTIGAIISETIKVLSGTGVTYTDLVMKVEGNAVQSFRFLNGSIPYLRTVINNGNPI